MNYLALLLAIINLSRHGLVQAEVKRKIVQIPGDLVLGGLFPMHEQVILMSVGRRPGLGEAAGVQECRSAGVQELLKLRL